ncbi:hypothetical protein K435DRAFT_715684 [Dendrothele bispora CBS 962.96]|uniref:Uncharacterized protein n=1 Tax=Dendrothele bispora (strain CBS 962.96) TaxID=1314807 RepID=A0A4S8MKH4_DENBC|nr:hypothetical protein K435DRAFT_715684 [Dendrothele bispora CBS 962.96]
MDNSKEPSSVWSDYLSLVNTLGHDHLDISLHQEVLRKCTPPSHALRNISNRRLRYHQDPRSFLHESRFQTIIRNIRAIGSTPSIDDYHFILEQFAAVGHHVGAMQVYRELIQSSTPQKKTFGLCLQAIAHRLSLPKRPKEQEQEIQHARVMMSELLNGMEKYAVPFSSINLDFTIRIMKETSDIQGFESLMKLGYGIDLAHPDHPSLEVLGMRSADSNVSVPAQPLYFSVSALNAVVDLYGKTGNISRMVQAFEVLTVPLPQAQQHFFSSFEDDDDFGVSSSPSVMPPFVPSVSPNTATFKILLRNLAKASHFQLLRHYLLVAMELDRQVAYLTRLNLVSLRDISDVPSPTFAIGRSMVLSAFSHSNRRKRLAFMKWLTKKLPRIIKKKQKDLDFYKNFRKGLQKRKQWPTAPTTPSLDATSKISPSDQLRSSNAAPAFVPPPKSIWGYWRGYRWRIADVQSVVNADVADESDPESSGPPFKPLNLNLHIKLLENEIEDLVSIKERIGKIKSRMHDRIKDRLGRRVWAGKDIYFMTGGTRRGRISRLRWREMVNYKVKTTSDENGSVTVLRDVKSI